MGIRRRLSCLIAASFFFFFFFLFLLVFFMLMDYWDSFLSANRLVDRDISLADWIILHTLIVDLLFFFHGFLRSS